MSETPEDKTPTDDSSIPVDAEASAADEGSGPDDDGDVAPAADETGADEAKADESGDAGADDAIQALEERVATLEKEKKDGYERLLRATADLDNFRKRSRRDVEDARVDYRSKVLRDILPVIDNMDRALNPA
mgnify:CR=1 FL=1